MVAQFEHPLEKDFFKTYWVPLESDNYDLFIDLSSKRFVLFEIEYFPFEPYQWTKKIWFEDMSKFLVSATDSSIDIKAGLKENKRIWESQIDDLLKKRNSL